MTVRLKPVEDQVIVITGASSGIGLATARLFAERGAKGLVLVSRNADALRQIADDLSRRGTRAIPVAAERPVSGCVNQETADSERIGIRFHDCASLAELTANKSLKGADLPTKKRIRAAHAEKQQIRETCGRPNRLNLCVLTAKGGRRSKFFRSIM